MIFLPIVMSISKEKIDNMKEALYERCLDNKHRRKFLIGGLHTLRSLVDGVMGGSDNWRITEACRRLARLGYIRTVANADRPFSTPKFYITPKLFGEMRNKEQSTL